MSRRIPRVISQSTSASDENTNPYQYSKHDDHQNPPSPLASTNKNIHNNVSCDGFASSSPLEKPKHAFSSLTGVVDCQNNSDHSDLLVQTPNNSKKNAKIISVSSTDSSPSKAVTAFELAMRFAANLGNDDEDYDDEDILMGNHHHHHHHHHNNDDETDSPLLKLDETGRGSMLGVEGGGNNNNTNRKNINVKRKVPNYYEDLSQTYDVVSEISSYAVPSSTAPTNIQFFSALSNINNNNNNHNSKYQYQNHSSNKAVASNGNNRFFGKSDPDMLSGAMIKLPSILKNSIVQSNNNSGPTSSNPTPVPQHYNPFHNRFPQRVAREETLSPQTVFSMESFSHQNIDGEGIGYQRYFVKDGDEDDSNKSNFGTPSSGICLTPEQILDLRMMQIQEIRAAKHQKQKVMLNKKTSKLSQMQQNGNQTSWRKNSRDDDHYDNDGDEDEYQRQLQLFQQQQSHAAVFSDFDVLSSCQGNVVSDEVDDHYRHLPKLTPMTLQARQKQHLQILAQLEEANEEIPGTNQKNSFQDPKKIRGDLLSANAHEEGIAERILRKEREKQFRLIDKAKIIARRLLRDSDRELAILVSTTADELTKAEAAEKALQMLEASLIFEKSAVNTDEATNNSVSTSTIAEAILATIQEQKEKNQQVLSRYQKFSSMRIFEDSQKQEERRSRRASLQEGEDNNENYDEDDEDDEEQEDPEKVKQREIEQRAQEELEKQMNARLESLNQKLEGRTNAIRQAASSLDNYRHAQQVKPQEMFELSEATKKHNQRKKRMLDDGGNNKNPVNKAAGYFARRRSSVKGNLLGALSAGKNHDNNGEDFMTILQQQQQQNNTNFAADGGEYGSFDDKDDEFDYYYTQSEGYEQCRQIVEEEIVQEGLDRELSFIFAAEEAKQLAELDSLNDSEADRRENLRRENAARMQAQRNAVEASWLMSSKDPQLTAIRAAAMERRKEEARLAEEKERKNLQEAEAQFHRVRLKLDPVYRKKFEEEESIKKMAPKDLADFKREMEILEREEQMMQMEETRKQQEKLKEQQRQDEIKRQVQEVEEAEREAQEIEDRILKKAAGQGNASFKNQQQSSSPSPSPRNADLTSIQQFQSFTFGSGSASPRGHQIFGAPPTSNSSPRNPHLRESSPRVFGHSQSSPRNNSSSHNNLLLKAPTSFSQRHSVESITEAGSSSHHSFGHEAGASTTTTANNTSSSFRKKLLNNINKSNQNFGQILLGTGSGIPVSYAATTFQQHPQSTTSTNFMNTSFLSNSSNQNDGGGSRRSSKNISVSSYHGQLGISSNLN